PARADEADAHAGGRHVLAIQHLLQVGDPRALVDKGHDEELLARRPIDAEAQRAAFAVDDRVARDLRDGGGDAGLILAAEADRARDLASPLTGMDDILLGPQRHRQDRPRSHAALFITRTVASSRPREASR